MRLRLPHVVGPLLAFLPIVGVGVIVVVAGGAACKDGGTFAGGLGPGGGFEGAGAGIAPADVGKPCTSNPAGPSHPSPANQCADKLDCPIVSSDAAETGYDFGLGLP